MPDTSAYPLTAALPRVRLATMPTPLEEMTRLHAALGTGLRLLIKRDDLTGLATGGNKTRKLEFLIGQALAEGADAVITPGGAQSNHCRQTAAAAAVHGLRCVLVLTGSPVPADEWTGNLLLDDLLGAEVRWTEGRPREEVMQETAAQLIAEGAKPYVIPTGGSVAVGAAGYVAAVEELAVQQSQQNEHIDRIVIVSGSGGTHAGVLVGVKALGLDIRVDGMNNFAIPDIEGKVRLLAVETAEYLGLNLQFEARDFHFTDAAGLHPYGQLTAAERNAIRLLARTEGILLDPVYTGRAFAQMITAIKTGQYRPDETVLFWHTGGVPGLFAYAADLMQN